MAIPTRPTALAEDDAGPEPARVGAKGVRTRERVKLAFIRLLGAQSFGSITIADVCTAADITVGGFYFHFSRLDDLLLEVVEEYIQAHVQRFGAALDESPPDDLAAAVCGAFESAYSSQPGLARTVQQMSRLRVDIALRWREANAPCIERLAERLVGGQNEGARRRAYFLATALITMVMSKLDSVYVFTNRAGVRSVAPDALLVSLAEAWRRVADLQGGAA